MPFSSKQTNKENHITISMCCLTWEKDCLCTDVKWTAPNTPQRVTFPLWITFNPIFSVIQRMKSRYWDVYELLHLLCFGTDIFADCCCFVSYSSEGDSRHCRAAGAFCCLSMGTEAAACRASREDPADVKQHHSFATWHQLWSLDTKFKQTKSIFFIYCWTSRLMISLLTLYSLEVSEAVHAPAHTHGRYKHCWFSVTFN